MNAKFKRYSQLMKTINEGIVEKNQEIEWYKFKVQQVASRINSQIN